MPRLNYVVGISLLALCAGCSRYTIQSGYDPGADFHALRTYAWQPGPQRSIGDPRVSDALVDATVRRAVDRELTAKGYSSASADSADFVLAYDGGVDYDSSVVAVDRSIQLGGAAWVGRKYADTANFEQGTIVLLVFNRRTTRPMWRGVASGLFDPTATPDERRERIATAIHKVLKEFPPN